MKDVSILVIDRKEGSTEPRFASLKARLDTGEKVGFYAEGEDALQAVTRLVLQVAQAAVTIDFAKVKNPPKPPTSG